MGTRIVANTTEDQRPLRLPACFWTSAKYKPTSTSTPIAMKMKALSLPAVCGVDTGKEGMADAVTDGNAGGVEVVLGFAAGALKLESTPGSTNFFTSTLALNSSFGFKSTSHSATRLPSFTLEGLGRISINPPK